MSAALAAYPNCAVARSPDMTFTLRSRRAQVKRVLALIELYSRG
jgi:hypothetical protein